LTSTDLLCGDSDLNAERPRRSSVDTLLASDVDLAGIIRGPHSLGGLLAKRGCPCTPSPDIPVPVSPEALRRAEQGHHDIRAINGPPDAVARASTYFWGGYSIRRYGVADTIPAPCSPLPKEAAAWTKDVAAIQLETAWNARQSEHARAVRLILSPGACPRHACAQALALDTHARRRLPSTRMRVAVALFLIHLRLPSLHLVPPCATVVRLCAFTSTCVHSCLQKRWRTRLSNISPPGEDTESSTAKEETEGSKAKGVVPLMMITVFSIS